MRTEAGSSHYPETVARFPLLSWFRKPARSLAPGVKSPRRRIRLRAGGYTCLFLTCWLPIAGMVTGNNFLFILLGLTVGLVAVSHILARANQARVTVTRVWPEEIFAGAPFLISYQVGNPSAGSQSLALYVRETAPLIAEGPPAVVPRVGGNEILRPEASVSLAVRGEHEIAPPSVSSSFPFGLAEYSVSRGETAMVLVFPRIEPVTLPWLADPIFQGSGSERLHSMGTITHHFRDYIPGDPIKHIDWKKTAAAGRLISRAKAEESAWEILVKLPSGAGEKAISRAASIVVHLGAAGAPLSFAAPGLYVPPGTGPQHTKRILTILAKWDGRASGPVTVPKGRRVTTIDMDGSGNVMTSAMEVR